MISIRNVIRVKSSKSDFLRIVEIEDASNQTKEYQIERVTQNNKIEVLSRYASKQVATEKFKNISMGII